MVECGLDNGINVTGGTECQIIDCDLRNLRRLGIRVIGGTKHRVISCDTGAGTLGRDH